MRNGQTEWVDDGCVSPQVFESEIRRDGLYFIGVYEKNSDAGEERAAFASFIIDRTPPSTTITKIDAVLTDTKRFAFTASDAWHVRDFQCRLDNGFWYNCASPETIKTSDGLHKFEVRAIDQANNVDPIADVHSWHSPSLFGHSDDDDFYGRAVLQYYGGADDDDDDDSSNGFLPTLSIAPSNESGAFALGLPFLRTSEDDGTSSSDEDEIDGYYDDFYGYGVEDASPDGPEEVANPYKSPDSPDVPFDYSASPLDEDAEDDDYYFPYTFLGYNLSVTNGSWSRRQENAQGHIEINRTSSSDPDNRIGYIIPCVTVLAFFAICCGVTIYARYVQLQLRLSERCP